MKADVMENRTQQTNMFRTVTMARVCPSEFATKSTFSRRVGGDRCRPNPRLELRRRHRRCHEHPRRPGGCQVRQYLSHFCRAHSLITIFYALQIYPNQVGWKAYIPEASGNYYYAAPWNICWASSLKNTSATTTTTGIPKGVLQFRTISAIQALKCGLEKKLYRTREWLHRWLIKEDIYYSLFHFSYWFMLLNCAFSVAIKGF